MKNLLTVALLCIAANAHAAPALFAMDGAAELELVRDATGGSVEGGSSGSAVTTRHAFAASQEFLFVRDRTSGVSTVWTPTDLVDPALGVNFGDRAVLATGLAPDGQSLEVLVLHSGQYGVFRDVLLRRTNAAGVPEIVRSYGPGEFAPELAAWIAPVENCPGGGCAFGDSLPNFGLATSDARVCIATRDGIVCVETTGQPAVRLRLSIDALRDIPADPIPQSLAWDPVYGFGPDTEEWSLGPMTGAADGRLWFIADRRFISVPEFGPSTVRQAVRYILELAADGKTLTVLDGPHLGGGPLAEARFLGFDERLDALVAFPGPAWDPVDISYYGGGDGGGNVLTGRRSYVGLGMRVVPVHGGGGGYLSVTDSASRQLRCQTGNTGGLGKAQSPGTCFFGPVQPGLATLYDEGVRQVGVAFSAGVPEASGAAPFVVSRLTFDRDRLDLDGDGLDAAAERALGTSEFARDTDGGGTNDWQEARVAGTDPTDSRDDPAIIGGARRETIIYTQSTDISRHLPAMTDLAGAPALTPSSAGPACSQSRCYAPDGAVLVDYSDVLVSGRAVRSVDGSFVTLPVGEGLVRVFIADGRRELYVSGPDWYQLGPDSAIVPVDASHTWVVSPMKRQVVLFEAGAAPRVVFDAEVERCAAKLGPCDPRPKPQAELFVAYINGFPTYVPMPTADVGTVEYVGYNDVLGRVEVFVQGSLESWWVGVDEAGPVVVARGREMAGLNASELPGLALPPRARPPELFMATGRGDFMTEGNVLDPWLSPRATVSRQESFEPFGSRPFTAWGDTVLRGVTLEGGKALSELVRYDEGLEPGDIVYAAQVEAPFGEGTRETDRLPRTMLYRVGPRGGAVPLWDVGRSDILEPVSLAVAPDGWACIVDTRQLGGWPGKPSAIVHLLGPVATRGGIPGVSFTPLESADVTACAFDDDSALLTLHTAPPRIERRASSAAGPGTGAPEITPLNRPDGLPQNALPTSFFHAKSGFEVDWSSPQFSEFRALLDDGRTARIDPAGLTIDGQPAHPRLAAYARMAIEPKTGPYAPRVTIVDRGQGDLVIAGLPIPGVGMNLGSGELWELTAEWGRVRAVARVPGGERERALDPWTGLPVTRTPVATSPGTPGDPNAPAIPTAPTAPPTEGSDRLAAAGCAGGSGGPLTSWPAAVATWAAWAFWHRRRRLSQPLPSVAARSCVPGMGPV